MIRDVKLSNVNNVITRVCYAVKSSIIISFIIIYIEASIRTKFVSVRLMQPEDNPLLLPSNLGICIQSIHANPVLLRNWHDGLPYAQEIVDILESQLQEHPSVTQ